MWTRTNDTFFAVSLLLTPKLEMQKDGTATKKFGRVFPLFDAADSF